MNRVRRALISVSDKTGVEDFARALLARGVHLLSTGGTAKRLRDDGIAVEEVSDYTGAPEILGGRVKTLHPRIHAGLLARPTPEHEAELRQHQIEKIDLVVVNLYPFRETIARVDVTLAEAIENIDVGGPTMLRAAAKNFERVAVVTDPADYRAVIEEMDRTGGEIGRELRFRLAARAFARTAAYDMAIAGFLGGLSSAPAADDEVSVPRFPETLLAEWVDGKPLRYGENPHQKAAFYRDPSPPLVPSVAWADVLQGKELSYNNILDLDSALGLVLEFAGAAAAIVKHNNPCGAAEGERLAEAYVRAREADPTSAFGGVVALNREVDGELAARLSETFLECIIAPAFTDEARAMLGAKKNLRLLAWRATTAAPAQWQGRQVRSVRGGALVQEYDARIVAAADCKVATRRAPTEEELRALDFAWRVCKHVRSNAIVLGRPGVTVGIGAGQMSRVDSVRLAVEKSIGGAAGTVMASDAFFPFRDGVDAAAKAGVTCVIQPGGSVRDAEVFAAADEHGMAMVLTGMRHFRH